MYLLTEWEGRTENIWPEVMAYGPSAARSVRLDRGPNIFLSGPTLTQSISILSYGLFTLFISTQKMKLGQNKKQESAQKIYLICCLHLLFWLQITWMFKSVEIP